MYKGIQMTQERVMELFDYCELSGIMTNRVQRGAKALKGEEAGFIWSDPSRDNHKYKCVKVNSKEYKVHRLIWLYVYGEMPNGQIDHIDGNSLNNKIENLRVVDNVTNSKNRAIQSNNTSGYHGINQLPSGNWRVRISFDKQRITVGTFSSFEEAKAARLEAEKKYNYHENHGRKTK